MNPTFFPTQIGYTPTGSAYGSQVVIGRNMNTTWDAVGFGQGGRPDYVERIYLNITQASGVAPVQKAQIALDVKSLLNIIAANPNAPTTGFYFAFRELQICDASAAKAMVFMCSQPYAAV